MIQYPHRIKKIQAYHLQSFTGISRLDKYIRKHSSLSVFKKQSFFIIMEQYEETIDKRFNRMMITLIEKFDLT